MLLVMNQDRSQILARSQFRGSSIDRDFLQQPLDDLRPPPTANGHNPMSQDIRSQIFDIIRGRIRSTLQPRPGLSRAIESDGTARTDAETHLSIDPRRPHQGDDILLDR
jgi:hypothetical protein